MLTSLPREFRVVDAYRRNGAGDVVRSAFRSLRELPRELRGSWRLGTAPWVAVRAWYARKDRTLVSKRNSVIGARVSIRQESDLKDRDRHIAFDAPEILKNKNFILNIDDIRQTITSTTDTMTLLIAAIAVIAVRINGSSIARGTSFLKDRLGELLAAVDTSDMRDSEADSC